MKCPLCNQYNIQQRDDIPQFYNCEDCSSIFRDPADYPSPEAEKARYLTHNNDVEDQRYQNFVRPIVNAVTHSFTKEAKGLDFGAGTGPVISKMLRDQGFEMILWDPFFHPDRSVLNTTYDFIVCCEVMEHFHDPRKEFLLMKQLLKPEGKLFCKTEFLPEKLPFKDWYYKDDLTHVIFYQPGNLIWVKEHLGFSGISIEENLIIFHR